MLTLLSSVKNRLGLAELEIQYDALLATMIAAVSARFNLECRRTLERTVNATYEFSATDLVVLPPCTPVEAVSGLELKTAESLGWVACPDFRYIVKRACIVEFGSMIGAPGQQARLTYTGGYVLPGSVPGPGQAALPRELEQAATEQTAWWFQNRDRLGLHRLWEYHGTYRQFTDLDLIEPVRAVLRHFQRWSV